MIDKPGKYNISFEEYLSDPCPEPSLSRSTIATMLSKSPRHAFYEHPRLNPCVVAEKEAEHFDIGTAAHSLFLQGTDIAEIIDAKDWRKDETKAKREEARKNGKVPLLKPQAVAVMEMVEAAHNHLADSELGLLIKTRNTELTYVWRDYDDIWCRIRPDFIDYGQKIILDYKTTGISAKPDSFFRGVVANGLDIQEAFYRRGTKVIDAEDYRFVFMVQETYPPYLCSFIDLNPEFQNMGRQKVDKGITKWAECMSSGRWTGYPTRVATIEAPAYAIAAWEFQSMMMEETSGNIPF